MSMPTYRRRTELPVPAAEAFAWHERPGALRRLSPPWSPVRVEDEPEGLQPGTRKILRVGPLRTRWVAEHVTYDPPHEFSDVQRSGPFAEWDHRHLFEDLGGGRSALTDEVTYRLPAGRAGSAAERVAHHQLERMFTYRHAVTAGDLAFHAAYTGPSLTVAVSGATGLIGSALSAFLTTGGHEVVRMVRRPARRGQVSWDPDTGYVQTDRLRGVNAVVHVAAEPITPRPMTGGKRRRLWDSRVQGTRAIAAALAGMDDGPRILVSASGSNIYGDRGDEELTEDSAPGTEGFLCDLTREWEEALAPARDAGVRVVAMRNGIVLDRTATILRALGTVTRLGAAAPVGSGRQYWPWVSINDLVGMYHRALTGSDMDGAVNACAPHPVTNAAFTRTLAHVLRRPVWPLRVPRFVPGLLLGPEMADSLLFTSMRMLPARLDTLGFECRHAQLESALRELYGRWSR